MSDRLDAIDERRLPPQMRRIVRVIGIGAAYQLLRWRGGRQLKLPRDSQRSELTDVIGPHALEALVAEFGAQEVLTLPKTDKMVLQMRNRKICDEYADGDGKSIPVLAGLYGLTRRHVTNILGAGRDSAKEQPGQQPERRQLALF